MLERTHVSECTSQVQAQTWECGTAIPQEVGLVRCILELVLHIEAELSF